MSYWKSLLLVSIAGLVFISLIALFQHLSGILMFFSSRWFLIWIGISVLASIPVYYFSKSLLGGK